MIDGIGVSTAREDREVSRKTALSQKRGTQLHPDPDQPGLGRQAMCGSFLGVRASEQVQAICAAFTPLQPTPGAMGAAAGTMGVAAELLG